MSDKPILRVRDVLEILRKEPLDAEIFAEDCHGGFGVRRIVRHHDVCDESQVSVWFMHREPPE